MTTGPLLLIDGDCGFCQRCAEWARRRVRPRAELVPFQYIDVESLGVSVAECSAAVQWVSDGRVAAHGARAVASLLSTGRPPWPTVGRVMLLPGFSRLSESVYGSIARHRSRIPTFLYP